MEIFSLGGMLPLLVIFAAAVYSVAVVGLYLARRLPRRAVAVELAGVQEPALYDRPTLTGMAAVALSGIALLSEILLLMARSWPERVRVSLIVALFPILTLCAIAGVAIGSATLARGKWNLVGVVLGMVVLVSLSVWLLSPVLFPK